MFFRILFRSSINTFNSSKSKNSSTDLSVKSFRDKHKNTSPYGLILLIAFVPESFNLFPLKAKNRMPEKLWSVETPSIVRPLSLRLISYSSEKYPVDKALTPGSFILFPFNYNDFKFLKLSEEARFLQPIGPILLLSW